MKWIALLLSLIMFKSCGDNDQNLKINLKTNANTYRIGDTLRVSLRLKKIPKLDSTRYFLNQKRIELPYVFSNQKLGDHQLSATHYYQGKTTKSDRTIRLLKSTPPELWTYTIINEYPHDKTAYTQGLEFEDEVLYESTGLKGKSSLRKIDFKTGEIKQQIPLDNSYFGEGITLLNKQIYQLTWLENVAFVYDPISLKMERSFTYNESKEGWGLCNDGTYLYKSDGTAKIWKLDTETGKELDFIQATTHKTILTKINELEWVNGKIYANTYQAQKEVAVVIDPLSGAIEKVIDFSGLKEKVEQIPSLNVLNGIAYHPGRKTFFITGKNWSKLFEVTLQKK